MRGNIGGCGESLSAGVSRDMLIFFFSSRRRHTRFDCDWSSDVCSSDLFGVSLVLQNYALWQFGPVARKIQEPFTGHFTLFYLDYPWYRLVIAVLSAAIIGDRKSVV